jgi:hypothetical protein
MLPNIVFFIVVSPFSGPLFSGLTLMCAVRKKGQDSF